MIVDMCVFYFFKFLFCLWLGFVIQSFKFLLLYRFEGWKSTGYGW